MDKVQKNSSFFFSEILPLDALDLQYLADVDADCPHLLDADRHLSKEGSCSQAEDEDSNQHEAGDQSPEKRTFIKTRLTFNCAHLRLRKV